MSSTRDHDPRKLLDILEPVLAELPHAIRHKAMFGGFGVYVEDRIFISLSNVGVAFKLSASDHAALLAEGGEGLSYEPSTPPSKSYAVVPSEWHDKPAKLSEWATLSARFVLGATKK